MMRRHCPSGSRLLKPFLKFKKIVYNGKMTSRSFFHRSKLKLWNFSNFTLWNLKKGFSNLELEGQGHSIIMGVTCLLLLGLFYSIQTNYMYFFAHDCNYNMLSNWVVRIKSLQLLIANCVRDINPIVTHLICTKYSSF